VLPEGHVRGADCWHLAAALDLAEDPGAITFLTLDERQAAVARSLGFRRRAALLARWPTRHLRCGAMSRSATTGMKSA